MLYLTRAVSMTHRAAAGGDSGDSDSFRAGGLRGRIAFWQPNAQSSRYPDDAGEGKECPSGLLDALEPFDRASRDGAGDSPGHSHRQAVGNPLGTGQQLLTVTYEYR